MPRDDRLRVFALWIGYILQEKVESILCLQDGGRLAKFFENLSGLRVEDIKDAETQQENVQNIRNVFVAIERSGIPLAALTCSDEEVVEGDQDMILSLIWDLTDHFFISPQFPSSSDHWKSAFLRWCQERCEPRGVFVTDFHQSFQDGMALCAIVDSALEDSSVIGMLTLKSANSAKNLSLAFDAAHRLLDVPKLLEVEDLQHETVDERSVLLYLAVLRLAVEGEELQAPAALEAHEQPQLASQRVAADMQEFPLNERAAARSSIQRALLGRADAPKGPDDGSSQLLTEDLTKVSSLLDELREPISMVAEILQRAGGEEAMDAKATFRQLTERMKRLVEVLPDTLECTQEASILNDSIQMEFRRVRAREEFEEAYISRVCERQRQCHGMSIALQSQIRSEFEELRQPVRQLLQILDEREAHLLQQVAEIEQDKTAILKQAQTQAERDLVRLQEAEAEADNLLKSKIASVSWLETGHRAEKILKDCEAGKVDDKQDFPDHFVDFCCTLNLRLQHNIIQAFAHVLRNTEFEERKLLDQAELLASGSEEVGRLGSSRGEGLDVIRRHSKRTTGAGEFEWQLTAEGEWVKKKEAEESTALDKIIAHAKKLPIREADEYLSQEAIQSVLQGSRSSQYSHGIVKEAYNQVNSNYLSLPTDLQVRPPLLPLGEGIASQVSQANRSTWPHAMPNERSAEGTLEFLRWFQLDSEDSRVLSSASVAVCAIGGWDGNQNLRTIELISPGDTDWRMCTEMSSSRRGAAAVSVEGDIWILGGWDGQNYLRSCHVFQLATGRWKQVADMHEARCYASATVMDGKIYVAGGYHGQVNLDSAEVWSAGEWHKISSMSTPRRGLGLAALDGHLYAVGGWDGRKNLSSVEAWTPLTGSWRKIPDLSTPRSSAAVIASRGKLFAIGGWDGKNFLSSLECYEPKYGTKRNPVGEWRTLPPMSIARSYAAAAAYDNLIFVLGGWDGTEGRRLDSVECFLVHEHRWISFPRMSCPRYGLAAALVKQN
uniref:Calponin-homology (CH) domain-containing protein n=1 Tax=Guillardia theta TaxID=55529 RepID=A0A7S4PHI3_GUITH|mmetsp:Transcript_51023/g.159429  ORF Transcript_51023/g.159429 Transcript_51023/m.159429 type:complete len:1005 (+) Transcript_51023:51-3065(+)